MDRTGRMPPWWLSRSESSPSPSSSPSSTPKDWACYIFSDNVPKWWRERAPGTKSS